MTLGFIHKTIKNSFNPLRKIIWLLKFCPVSALHSVVIWGLERSKIRADRYLCLCAHPSPPLAVLFLFHLQSPVRSLSSRRLCKWYIFSEASQPLPPTLDIPLCFPAAQLSPCPRCPPGNCAAAFTAFSQGGNSWFTYLYHTLSRLCVLWNGI